MTARTHVLAAPLLAAFALAGVVTAHAACVYTPLTSGVAAPVAAPSGNFTFTQSVFYWTAAAVRPQPGDDWDLRVYSGTAADPACVSGQLASSVASGSNIDFVIGDFNADPLGTYYAVANRYSGAADASVQWDDGPDAITVDSPGDANSMYAPDLVRVYDVFLIGGTSYAIDFFPETGGSGRLALFRNTGGGTYWAGRSASQLEVSGPTTYTAPATGFYALVVINDAAATFGYTLAVSSSPCGVPLSLSTTTPAFALPPGGAFAFEGSFPWWMGLAVRGNGGDWDAKLESSPAGGAAPECPSGVLASSALGGGTVDLVVGDFYHSNPGWYFGYASQFSGGASASVQFTSTQGDLTINGQATGASFGAGDLAHMYNVFLQAGHTYTFNFGAPAGINLALFANPEGGSYFVGRPSAVLTTGTTANYTAPTTDYYGIAVMNDAALAAGYTLEVAECGAVTALTPGTIETTPRPYAYYSFQQNTAYWTVVGVRNPSVDWDLGVSQDNVNGSWPFCATTVLGTSGYPLPVMDLVVGDFNANPVGTYYVAADQFTIGAFSAADVQWDSGSDQIVPNDNNLPLYETGPGEIVKCWDVRLVAGQTYAFDLLHGGGAGLQLLLFRNASGGVYWSGRSSAQFETALTQTYTAPSTGYYGLVVVNDDGVTDSYRVRVRTCDPVVTLPAPPASWVTNHPVELASWVPSAGYWSPVAVRAALPAEDWDVGAYSSATGGALGACASGILAASSFVAGRTDFVVGDFNVNPPGTYDARANRFSGTGAAYMGAFPGGQTLAIGGPFATRHVSNSFLVESWDVFLNAGQTYTAFFTHDNTLDAKACMFAPTGGVSWQPRSGAILESAYSKSFVAPATGWYGVVVVNDGGDGQFDVGINNGVTAADGAPPPARDALHGASPNPGRAGLHLQYALHDAAEVTFDVIDMAGRRVAHLSPGAKGAGEWTEAWAATDEQGRALPSGLYFVRMRLGDRVVGTQKLTLLE